MNKDEDPFLKQLHEISSEMKNSMSNIVKYKETLNFENNLIAISLLKSRFTELANYQAHLDAKIKSLINERTKVQQTISQVIISIDSINQKIIDEKGSFLRYLNSESEAIDQLFDYVSNIKK